MRDGLTEILKHGGLSGMDDADAKVALYQQEPKQAIGLAFIAQVLKVLYCLQVVSFLVLEKYLKVLKKLSEVITLRDQSNKRDGLKQLLFLVGTALCEVSGTKI